MNVLISFYSFTYLLIYIFWLYCLYVRLMEYGGLCIHYVWRELYVITSLLLFLKKRYFYTLLIALSKNARDLYEQV